MRNETARREIESLDYYLQNHTNDYSEESHTAMMMAIKALEQKPKTEQWQELKEAITEMRDNNGTGTQQEVCRFLVNYMNVLEKQMQELKIGHWFIDERPESDREIVCSNCDQPIFKYHKLNFDYRPNYCPNCGADMR